MPAAALISLLVCAAPVQVLPGDESDKDPSFAAYRKELEGAIKRKDAKFVRRVDDKAPAGPGEAERVMQFLAALPLEASPVIWETLTLLLSRGCGRTKPNEFACPLLFARAPVEFDWFGHSVLTKEVAIRAEPSEKGKVLTTRSYEIVKGVRMQSPGPWVRIQTLDGVGGHVRAGQVESPLDTRAFFRKGSKGWTLVFLGGGV